MSTASFDADPATVIEEACTTLAYKIRAKAEGTPDDAPHAGSASWCRWAAGILDEKGLGAWTRDRDLADAFEDLAGPILRRLRGLPEFRTWASETLEVRWSRKAMVIRDLDLEEPVAGRVKVIPAADRETWLGEGDVPAFRLELSLPFWMLATEDEMERGLHAVIAACGMDGRKPYLRKPDIHAHAATLARYGVSGPRQASAVAHAQSHPSHVRILRSFGFDPDSGQGLLWKDHVVEAQTNLVDQVEEKRKSRAKPKPKPKPPLRAVEDISDEPEN